MIEIVGSVALASVGVAWSLWLYRQAYGLQWGKPELISALRRRFSLSDILILVVATALGLVLVRYVLMLNWLDDPTGSGNPAVRSDRMYLLAIHLASPMLTALSLAAFVIGMRQPRLSLRRLAREPGFVAMLVVVMTTVYFIVHLALRIIANYYAEPPLFLTHLLWVLANMFATVGRNIAITWSVLALQGNWRLRSMRDGRLAVMLGCIWVAAWLLVDGREIVRMIRVNYF